MRRPDGFTLIEVVIALAIGVCIVLAVTGTVRSLSRAARTITETGVEDEAWLRFVAIFRRDIRGWMPREDRQETGRRASPDAERPFLVCRTTADPLCAGMQSGEQPVPRMVTVRYSVKREGEEYALVRQEECGLGSFSVPVLRTNSEPKIEFFDGQHWTSGGQARQHPVPVRIILGDRRTAMVGVPVVSPAGNKRQP
jgi:prepilin-type N-terminal cleavage/methylation domain-containing protein